ncbi:MAG TPA: protease pro-enzyme activation domain-containing protein, partial [Ktedonobacteraceae bacterium]|nr:protease pro-enzyme activation domain-containing protein [Ktedonobacteraceae bacterium]
MSVRELNPRTTLLQRILICCALLVLLSACGGGTNAQSTPTATTLQLVTFDLGIPKAALNSPVVGSVPDTTKFHVIVTFKPNDDVLNRLGTSKVSSTQTTDGADLANQLGITNEQYAQVKQFFGIQGVSLNLSKLHTSLALDAPASSFAQLLKTKFVYHEYQGRKFFAPASDVRLPLAIATHIQAITGLDNYSLPPQKKSLKTSLALPLSTRTNEAANCAADPRTLFPQDIAGAYGLKPLYNQGWLGQGTTIILPEFEAFSQSDLQNYLACVQFKGKINVVTVNNHVPTIEGGEALLDLEMVAGLLPAANIVVYQEDPGAQYEYFWESFYDILNQIASDYSKVTGPTQISMSWGQAETHMTIGEVNAIDTQLRIISQVDHINTFVASGDCGAYDSTHYPGFLDTDFPSSDRAVIGVGGTELAVDQQLNRAQEIVWSGDPQKYPD